MMGDSQGHRGVNSKYGITAEAGGIFFEIRPFEKGRGLVLLDPMGLEQSQVLRTRVTYFEYSLDKINGLFILEHMFRYSRMYPWVTEKRI